MKYLNYGVSKKSKKLGIKPYSIDNFSPCVKKERNEYTGSNMLGVSTLHKSNSVPVFNDNDLVDHANMRRN